MKGQVKKENQLKRGLSKPKFPDQRVAQSPVPLTSKMHQPKQNTNQKGETSAMDMMNKYSNDNKFREIRDIKDISNISNNSNYDLIKKRNSQKNLSDVNISSQSNIRPSTPKTKVNNYTGKQSKPGKINKKISRDTACIIIQRAFRKYHKKLKNDPKYEMMNLLKKKKMNVLKNYNINVTNANNSSYNTSNIVHAHSNNDINGVSNSTIRDEDRMTANFGKEIKKKPFSQSPIKEANDNSNKPNFNVDDYDSFLTSKNDQQKYSDKYLIPVEDKNEDLDILDIITNKDTSMKNDDMSEQDTVNVYEKIFKEIKKESTQRKSKTKSDTIVPLSAFSKVITDQEVSRDNSKILSSVYIDEKSENNSYIKDVSIAKDISISVNKDISVIDEKKK